MKTRTILDIIIILVFVGVSGFFGYKYLGDPKKNPPRPVLEEDLTPVTDSAVTDLITRTAAIPETEDWKPEILSNRWEYIEIYQTGMLSGNNQTISKRMSEGDDSGFHFIITNGYGAEDGRIDTSNFWKTQQECSPLLDSAAIHPNHPERSYKTISICLIGDFTVQPPTKRQVASLKGLLNYLLKATPIRSYNVVLNESCIPQGQSSLACLPLQLLLKTRETGGR